jgi:hypothetical protein
VPKNSTTQNAKRRELCPVRSERCDPVTIDYRFSRSRMKPSNPCGMKMTMAMKITPSGMR